MSAAACPQCGQAAELSLMDFGPYVGQLICDDCWEITDPWDGLT